jgi:hypothetical protein
MLTIAIAAVNAAKAAPTSTSNYHEYLSAKKAVCHIFGSYCYQAMEVVKCETGGTYSPWAHNGQYVNIFQMGYTEREKYGWHTLGSSVWIAARAAWRYFVASGKDWSPWSCKPW